MFTQILVAIGLVVVALFHAAGIYFAIQGVMISRTPQASIGWGFALVICPYVAIPLFLIFGESRFSGYALAGQDRNEELDAALRQAQRALTPFRTSFATKYSDAEQLGISLRGLPPSKGNACKLLIDGKETFRTIFQAIESARSYVIVQFYIIHDDSLGRELRERLIEASRRGVRCWLLYDNVGSKGLSRSYFQELQDVGVAVQGFVTNRQFGRQFQINFRNHRKLVVVDGKVAFFGGLNAGDEYPRTRRPWILARYAPPSRRPRRNGSPGILPRRLVLRPQRSPRYSFRTARRRRSNGPGVRVWADGELEFHLSNLCRDYSRRPRETLDCESVFCARSDAADGDRACRPPRS